MSTRRLLLYFPKSETEKPILYHLVKDYDLLINIFRAKVTPEEYGYLVLDVMGSEQNIARGMMPRIYGRSYAIEAELEVPADGAEGVIVASGDFMGGFSFWVDSDCRLRHTYSFLGVEVYRQISDEPLPSGDVSVKLLFEADEPKPRTPGKVTLWANGKQIGEGRLDQTVPVAFSSYAGMDVGRDNRGVVDLGYEEKVPYAFTGVVEKVVFDLKPAHVEAEQDLHAHEAVQAVAGGIAA